MGEGQKFLDSLATHGRMMAGTAQKTCADNPEACGWLLDTLAIWSEAAFGPEIFEKAAKGYVRYCLHVARCQGRYEKSGHYEPKELAEVNESVYSDKEYMIPYMWAAVLIYAFWPSMVRHIDFFRHEFLGSLGDAPRILELGCGHGVLGMLAAERCPSASVTGLDISPSAIEIARALHAKTGFGDRVRTEVQDVLTMSIDEADKYDAVICAMLAEHLPTPGALLASVASMLRQGGVAYFSTALESAQPDHVYEFNTESQVLALLEENGLRATSLISCGTKARPGDTFHPRALAAIIEHR